jgi:hypothetical protein
MTLEKYKPFKSIGFFTNKFKEKTYLVPDKGEQIEKEEKVILDNRLFKIKSILRKEGISSIGLSGNFI